MHTLPHVHQSDPSFDPDKDLDLSPLERHRLTLFKWRYSLETLGFAAHEIESLMFLTWLRATARVAS